MSVPSQAPRIGIPGDVMMVKLCFAPDSPAFPEFAQNSAGIVHQRELPVCNAWTIYWCAEENCESSSHDGGRDHGQIWEGSSSGADAGQAKKILRK